MSTTRTITSKEDVTDDLLEAVYEIVDGWHMDFPIDREDFLDRLESWAKVDMGDQMSSPAIEFIIRKARAYRREAM